MLDKLAKIETSLQSGGKRVVIGMSEQQDLNAINRRDLVRVTLLRPKSKFDDLIQDDEAPIDLEQITDFDRTNRTGIAIIDDGDREALHDFFDELRQLEQSIKSGLDAEGLFRHVL
uniref:Uncharacterized protein n=2 Tax=Aplanochytrium stocchinoi TaxID=215587 RepID=A0A7S3LJH7_9STRA|mmetsp:Transcript_1049/g.1549  ORF Transcript_1049/g.1549 Transcript_1049/m.1549 type:complete len:116 (-) Transcript_1049:148-495(-)